MELVENSEVYPGLDSFRRASALEALCAMLSCWSLSFILWYVSEELNFWGGETNFVGIINIWDKLFTMSSWELNFKVWCVSWRPKVFSALPMILSIGTSNAFHKTWTHSTSKFSSGLIFQKYYVVRGIMDYQAMSLMKDDSCSWDQVFKKVVDKPYHRWIQNIPHLLWMDTRYYKHQFYDIIHQPLQLFLPTPWSS